MRVNAICGFLGSGKTTLLRRILAERAGAEKLAVIVNEFGAVGVDGAILAGASVDVIEITAGCLCCTLKGSLLNALEELRDTKGVQRVVVEASGVAQPGEMLEVLGDSALAGTVTVGPMVTVIDAAKFASLRKVLGGFYTAQVARADVLVLNKRDLAAPEQLARVRQEVTSLNPRAAVVVTERCDVELAMVLDGDGQATTPEARGSDGTAPRAPGGDAQAPAPSALEQGLASPAPAASFVSFVAPAPADADGGRLHRFFAALPPAIVRAKGFMVVDGQPRTVQFAAGQLEITPAPPGRPSRLVFISAEEPDRAAVAAALATTARA